MLNTATILYGVNFSASLKQLRKKAGLTQAELADAIGTTQGAVGHYEMGIKAPELAKLPAIAKALGVSVADLFAEPQGKEQAAKQKRNPNRRIVKLQKAFDQLKPIEQQMILKQMQGLLPKRQV